MLNKVSFSLTGLYSCYFFRGCVYRYLGFSFLSVLVPVEERKHGGLIRNDESVKTSKIACLLWSQWSCIHFSGIQDVGGEMTVNR